MSLPNRIHQPKRPVFITAVTNRRLPWMQPVNRKLTLIASITRVSRLKEVRSYAYVVLDDHLHWIVHPSMSCTVGDIVSALKRDVTWRLRPVGLPTIPWQARFYDHVIRDADDFKRHLDYIHFNPVKHGYVRVASDYRWSSLGDWSRRGIYPSFWGVGNGPKRIASMNLE